MNDERYDILTLDEEFQPIIVESECEELKPIVKDFVKTYARNHDKPVESWLASKMQEYLPEKSDKEIKEIAEGIISSINVSEEKSKSLNEAVNNGRSKESWFASEMKTATSAMAAQEASKYLAGLDLAMKNANEAMYRTITTQAGIVNQNPRLDGFIAEQYHAQTFNLNAEATGSQYRAKVLEPPPGKKFAKNSVDIEIVDGNGKVVRRYQSKYCKDAKATVQAFEEGKYQGQQKLVPEGQEGNIGKKCNTVIEAPDGTTSNPLSKPKAEQMRDEAQSGNWNELNWNEYKMKDLAMGIGKQAGYAALQGAAIGVGFDIAHKLWNGEEIKGEEVVEKAILTGADFGVKAAVGGALKVGVEKNIIKAIPKGTPASTIANIAFVAVEDIKIVGKMIKGELSFREGIEKIEQTTVSTAAGLVGMGKGATAGAAIGTVFGPVGTAIGGFIGGTVGYMAGSKIGEAIVNGARKICQKTVGVVKTVAKGVVSAGKKAVEGIKNIAKGIKSLFSW